MRITSIKPSQHIGKRYVATFDTGDGKEKKFHFGQDGAYTYIDGAPEKIKEAYWARHYANAVERYRIDNLIPSAAMLSAYLLWGNSRDLETNLAYLNRLMKNK